MKIDRGQIQFREYVSTGREPYVFDQSDSNLYVQKIWGTLQILFQNGREVQATLSFKRVLL